MTVLPFKPPATARVMPIDVIDLGARGFVVHLFRSRDRLECVSIACANVRELQSAFEAISTVFKAPLPPAASWIREART